MITLTYSSKDVGPVCHRVARGHNDIHVIRDSKLVGPVKGTLIRWGSRWIGEANLTINTAQAVALARDKHESRIKLEGVCPPTWFTRDEIKVPCVIRPRRHHAAVNFHTCLHNMDIRGAIKACGKGWYASKLIEKSREFRVFILQGHIVAVSERFPANPGDVAWNLAVGGKLINCEKKLWPKSAIIASIGAMKDIGLDWGAVDVALDNEGKPLVFEVNTAPGLRNPYTISRIAKAFKGIVPGLEPAKGTTWKKLIHPSLL